MILSWPSSTLGTLDLGRNKVKRAKREYIKASNALFTRRTKALHDRAEQAFENLHLCMRNARDLQERALKRLDRRSRR